MFFNCILLIENDPLAAFVEKRIIENEKITNNLVVKSNGEEALTYIIEEKRKANPCPEVIVLDLILPQIDGFEFLEGFQKIKDKTDTKIIIITNSFLLEDEAKARNLKVDFYIEKPLTTEKFLVVAQKLTQRPISPS